MEKIRIDGLSKEEVTRSREKYGNNALETIHRDTFFKQLLRSLGDPIIRILLIALGIKTIFLIKFCSLHPGNMKGFFWCNGNETQEIVKPIGAHDFCFQRFIGMVCTRKRGIFHLCSPAETFTKI